MTRFTSRADLLIAAGESIKMQEKAGITPVFKGNGKVFSLEALGYCIPSVDLEFSLAVVEGKPVFRGDELYYGNKKVTADAIRLDTTTTTVNGKLLPYRHICCRELTITPYENEFSWNPPKPKTVMVELLREDAEWRVGKREYTFAESEMAFIRDKEACRKALEKA